MYKLIASVFLLTSMLTACDNGQAPTESATQPAETPISKAQSAADEMTNKLETKAQEMQEEITTEVKETVAEVVAATEPEPAQAKSGEQVYQASCQSCHASGAANAPKFADAAAWQPRIAKGMDALYASALNGVPGTAMLPKGTCAACSDDELKAAVDYMVEKAQ